VIINEVLENIRLLQWELQQIDSSIQNEIISVIIDGSIIRGDFIEDSSDIDMTITTLNKNVDFQIKIYVENVIRKIQVDYLKESIQESR
jgi:predicted nucleotidyltransferase